MLWDSWVALPPRRTEAPTTAVKESPGSSKVNPNGEHKMHAHGTKMPGWNWYFSAPRLYGLHGPCTESVSSVGLQEEAQAGSPGLFATAPQSKGATHASPDSIITHLRDQTVVLNPLPIDNQRHQPVQGRDRQDSWHSIRLGTQSDYPLSPRGSPHPFQTPNPLCVRVFVCVCVLAPLCVCVAVPVRMRMYSCQLPPHTSPPPSLSPVFPLLFACLSLCSLFLSSLPPQYHSSALSPNPLLSLPLYPFLALSSSPSSVLYPLPPPSLSLNQTHANSGINW